MIDSDLEVWIKQGGIKRADFLAAKEKQYQGVHYQIVDHKLYRSDNCMFGQRCVCTLHECQKSMTRYSCLSKNDLSSLLLNTEPQLLDHVNQIRSIFYITQLSTTLVITVYSMARCFSQHCTFQ